MTRRPTMAGAQKGNRRRLVLQEVGLAALVASLILGDGHSLCTHGHGRITRYDSGCRQQKARMMTMRTKGFCCLHPTQHRCNSGRSTIHALSAQTGADNPESCPEDSSSTMSNSDTSAAVEEKLPIATDTNITSSTTTPTIDSVRGDSGDQDSGIIFDISDIESFVTTFVTLKKMVYARIRQVLGDLIKLIKRSMKKSEAWVRDDAVGQLVFLGLANVAFLAAVAAFAAWNIELMGGKKWAGPSQVTAPVVRVPDSSSTGSVKFQKPKWNFPGIRTSYVDDMKKEGNSIDIPGM